jgi:hypothetical protein
MSAPDDSTTRSPAEAATALLGAVTQRALSTAGRLTLRGVATGLDLIGQANSVRQRVRRTGETVVQIASITPLGRLLPEPRYDDDAALEGQRIAHPPTQPPAARPARPGALPVSDFDTASLPSLRGRLRSLSVADLRVLRAHEQTHGRRVPVLTMLDNRIAKLTSPS